MVDGRAGWRLTCYVCLKALALGSWICLVLQIPYGLGRHGPVVSVADRTVFEHIGFWKTVFSDGVAMGLLRVSMAISLLRLKSDLKWYRWSLFAVVGELSLFWSEYAPGC